MRGSLNLIRAIESNIPSNPNCESSLRPVPALDNRHLSSHVAARSIEDLMCMSMVSGGVIVGVFMRVLMTTWMGMCARHLDALVDLGIWRISSFGGKNWEEQWKVKKVMSREGADENPHPRDGDLEAKPRPPPDLGLGCLYGNYVFHCSASFNLILGEIHCTPCSWDQGVPGRWNKRATQLGVLG